MIPLNETPIYTQLKVERQVDVLKLMTPVVSQAFQQIIDAFKPFMQHIMAIAKAMQRYDMSTGQPVRNPAMKPLLKNGRKP